MVVLAVSWTCKQGQQGVEGNRVCAFKRVRDTNSLVVNIQLKVDDYGEETSYDLVQIGGEDGGKVWLSSHNEVPANEMLEKEDCLPTDTDYNFTITDNAQDGICCQNGDGYFRITVDGKKVLKEGKSLKHESSYVIKLGYEPEMVGNDAIWLNAHNTARLDWYIGQEHHFGNPHQVYSHGPYDDYDDQQQ